MVQFQLCTMEHLMNSGFGRPFPRHGLQLLFWFSNNCLTLNSANVMKLLSDCDPDKGFYGFHFFRNNEEILPVLSKSKKCKRKYVYFEVGNLNTETYPGSANLPAYVRENYELDGNYGEYNIDRIIIGYYTRSRVVEMLFVTEHDAATIGRFNHDRTYEITPDLVRILQNPQLELTHFLTQMCYYGDIQMDQGAEGIHHQDLENISNMMQTYNGSTAWTEPSVGFRFFPEYFKQLFNLKMESSSQVWPTNYLHDMERHNNRFVVNYGEAQREARKSKPKKKWRPLRQINHLLDRVLRHYRAFYGEADEGSGGGGIGWIRFLLCAGALYYAAKCFRWCLEKWWRSDWNKMILEMIPVSTPSYPRTHIMLDYVY